MPYLDRSGVQLYYSVHGNGANPPLLLSHGFSASSAMWAGQIAALSRDYYLILWDMRGHGQSDYPSDPGMYSEAHTVADMSAILTHVCGNKHRRAIVGGLSLGGYMSLAFYRAHSDRVAALLIIDTGPGFKKDSAREGWNKYAYQTAARFERDGLAHLETKSAETRVARHRNATGLVLAARGMLTQHTSAVIESLPGVRVPALVVVGEEDTSFLAAAEYMARVIPAAKKVVIPKAGHASNIDQPQAFEEC
ncbi:hypothetical protein FE257_004915 [Aspergillus nanangensis]|uniref:AB hydrolase-1 domain-containing protein n=1 Tax=Aspergillus nanangensis TaxID=2582783 RepID=A0AAD4CAK1_ASPNN|nr:hypothetical protein FE257_004915 [Aspergillus nanangensis]